MRTARLRFHGELAELLPRALRQAEVRCPVAEHASAKHLIEALGVPHTEVGEVRIAGRAVALDAAVADDDAIDVFPVAPCAPAPDGAAAGTRPRFIADAHLGGLARRLRLLGFDTAFARDETDAQIAARAEGEERAVLSRDRELLKHRRIRVGRYVRAMRTQDQLLEVARRFGLRARIRPFSRCLECNGELRPADVEALRAMLPARVAEAGYALARCAGCGRVYWPGSHWRRLGAVVDAFVVSAG